MTEGIINKGLKLLEQYHRLVAQLEEGAGVDAVYMDFAKAFNKVDQGVFFRKLRLFGDEAGPYIQVESVQALLRVADMVLRLVRRLQVQAALVVSYTPFLIRYSRTTNFGPSYTESGRLLLQKVNTTDGSSSKIYNLILAKPLVDNSPSLPDSEYAKILQSEIPNLPIRYWQSLNNKFPAKNATCAIFPSLIDLQFNNVYWQTLKTSNGTFHLYGAYYDNRTLLAMEPVVRMLGMINRIEPTVQTICQLWFDGLEAPVFAEVSKYQLVWVKEWGNHKNGLFQPYLWSCKIPVDYRHLVPESVSLVEKPCDMAVTNLMVINNLPEGGKKGEFAVCVKGLDFPKEDLSVRLVEWFETLRHLGAEKIFLYELEVHPNITKVLNYYKKLGLVEVTSITLPGYQPNIKGIRHMYLMKRITNKYQNELIPYNDCLYKNMNKFKFIALLDIDEIIMPKGSNMLWKDLMEKIKETAQGQNIEYSSYDFRNVYFFDTLKSRNADHARPNDIPHYMHMFQHVYRAMNHTPPGHYIKCFHNTERVMTLHNHYPLACIGGGCLSYSVDTDDAQLQHYRADCVAELMSKCDGFKNFNVRDDAILRHKVPIISRVIDSLSTLGFF
ncbi:uncharacterized protein LOC108669282 [Hyalella azteca]|uniref:Glycosyltransferase family 92 protein n=1 Tax=Hyalella azteca TaxID=294128 RepID=A0A8B7NF51_HYAAZ|nr:uncharacterized protein LOC108669282 [Hyalella azteca]